MNTTLSFNQYKSLQALTFLGLGLFLLRRYMQGNLFWYINERFVLLIVGAAIGFLIVAQTLYTHMRAHRHHDHDHDHHHDHAHDHGDHDHDHSHSMSIWGVLLVALPLILGFAVPPKPLGASAISSRGVTTSAPVGDASASTQQILSMDPTSRTVLDWVQVFNDVPSTEAFVGEPVEVIGFVYNDPRLEGGDFLLGRFTLSCCVADAFAIGMVVDHGIPDAYADNGWLRISGTVDFIEIDGDRLPLIIPTEITEIPEPQNPYLYY